MSKSKHTPGPWVATGRYIGTPKHLSLIGECRDANGNWSDAAPASANARLIAAAPELLEALKLALNYIEISESGFNITLNSGNAARAAIAKATGGVND